MRPFSLRTRLTLYYSGILAVALAGFGFLFYHSLSLLAERSLTAELQDHAAALRGYLRYQDGQLGILFNPQDSGEAYFVHNATRYYQAFDLADGTLVAQSRDLELLNIVPGPQEVRALASRAPLLTDEKTSQGVIRFNNSVFDAGPQAFLIRVGISLRPKTAALEDFSRALLLLIPAGVLLAALGGWQMARHALRPMGDLAEAAHRIDLERLHERLPLRGTGDELDRLAEAFNDTLARLESAVAQMKQFTASVSHELRTPLTALRGEAEVALLELRSVEDCRRVLASQLEEFDKLTHLVNQLLILARAEAGEIQLANRSVDLSSLARSLGEQMEPVAAAKNIVLEVNAPGSIRVRGDANWLQRVILNLLDNAMKFTPEGGSVRLIVEGDATNAMLRVQDTGVGIPEDALPHIFDRFYRAEPSRSKAVEGVGLGLALVKWIVEKHRGQVDVETRAGRGSCFTVRLAAEPAPTESSGASPL